MAKKVNSIYKPLPVRVNLNAGGVFTCSCIDGKKRIDFKILSDVTQPNHYFCACGKIYTEHDLPAHS